MSDLPVISVFGVSEIKLETPGPAPGFETRELDCRCHLTDDELPKILSEDKPVAIVSIGESRQGFPNLGSAPFFIKRKWLHFGPNDGHDVIGRDIFRCFLRNVLERRSPIPLVSVFTPAYKTGDKILRPFHSLLSQTYADWEWIIMDDSDDDGETFALLKDLASRDHRIRVYKECRHSGSIGDVKRAACDLARGAILVELDHDDQLTPQCLQWLVSGYSKHPDVGFIYTDFAECSEGGDSVEYSPGWGFGYGSYRKENHNGMIYSVVNCPHINAKTIRHIIAAPNHVRSWRTTAYRAMGGHNPIIHVADDYEILIRTFLSTRMGHIPRMGYIQYRNQDGNTHRARNKEIQRLVRYFSIAYDASIHRRLIDLGVDDFIWDSERKQPSFFRLRMPNQSVESHCTVTIDV
jgi:O-antigen biosynthesis protein